MLKKTPSSALSCALAVIALAVMGCDDAPNKSTVSMDSKAGRPAPQFKGEHQAELLAKAAGETKAGNVEPAIAAYLEAEKLGALPTEDARAFATALRTNGESLLNKKERRRALANFTKALSVAPEEKENATVLAGWLIKSDATSPLHAEDAIASSLDEDLPGGLTPAAKTALAGVYLEHAVRLTGEGRDPWRAATVFDMAREMDAAHPELRSARTDAEPRLSEQVREMIEIDVAVDDELTKHPGSDAISVIAKRRKLDAQRVRDVVEAMAGQRQNLLDKLQATSWGVVADVEASVVHRTKLGSNTAELGVVVTGCDPTEHKLLARAAMDGIVEKLPKDVDSLRAPISYKGLRCELTATGLTATWRRSSGDLRFDQR